MGEANATSGYYGPLRPGSLRVGLALQFDPLTEPVYGDQVLSRQQLAAIDAEAAAENARFYSFAATLDARWAPTSWGEAFADLPYEVKVDRVDVADAHHRDETMQGLGDVGFGAHVYPLMTTHTALGVTLGLTLPTGRRNFLPGPLAFTDEDQAARLGLTVPAHSHLQLGLGAPALAPGADFSIQIGRHWLLYAQGYGTIPLGGSSDGYHTAPSGIGQIGPVYALLAPHLSLALLAEVDLSSRDHMEAADVPYKGGTLPGHFDVPNTGGVAIAADAVATYWVTSAWSAVLRLRVPVYTRVEGEAGITDIQIIEPVGFLISVAHDVDLGQGSP